MRTSNKILFGLLVVVFTVPLLLATSLKSKINKGEYIVKNYGNEAPQRLRSGSFTAFKVVKVVAPNPEYLRCYLNVSDKMNYTYNSYENTDSVNVYTRNDTLYVQYYVDEAKAGVERQHERLDVRLDLPAFNNIVADGAEVIIVSPASTGSLSVTLQNDGSIRNDSKSDKGPTSQVMPVESTNEEETVQMALVEDDNEFDNEEDSSEADTFEATGWNFKDLLISRVLTRF